MEYYRVTNSMRMAGLEYLTAGHICIYKGVPWMGNEKLRYLTILCGLLMNVVTSFLSISEVKYEFPQKSLEEHCLQKP